MADEKTAPQADDSAKPETLILSDADRVNVTNPQDEVISDAEAEDPIEDVPFEFKNDAAPEGAAPSAPETLVLSDDDRVNTAEAEADAPEADDTESKAEEIPAEEGTPKVAVTDAAVGAALAEATAEEPVAENIESPPAPEHTKDRLINVLAGFRPDVSYEAIAQKINKQVGQQLVDNGAITQNTYNYAGQIQIWSESIYKWKEADEAAALAFCQKYSIPVSEDGRIQFDDFFKQVAANLIPADTPEPKPVLSVEQKAGAVLQTISSVVNEIPPERIQEAVNDIEAGAWPKSIKIMSLYETLDPNVSTAAEAITAMHYIHRSDVAGNIVGIPNTDVAGNEQYNRQFEKLFGDESPLLQQLFPYAQKSRAIATGQAEARLSPAEVQQISNGLRQASLGLRSAIQGMSDDDPSKQGYADTFYDQIDYNDAIVAHQIMPLVKPINAAIGRQNSVLAAAYDNELALPSFIRDRLNVLAFDEKFGYLASANPTENNSVAFGDPSTGTPRFIAYDYEQANAGAAGAYTKKRAYEYAGPEGSFSIEDAVDLMMEVSLDKSVYSEGITLTGTEHEKRMMYFAVQRLNEQTKAQGLEITVHDYKPPKFSLTGKNGRIKKQIDERLGDLPKIADPQEVAQFNRILEANALPDEPVFDFETPEQTEAEADMDTEATNTDPAATDAEATDAENSTMELRPAGEKADAENADADKVDADEASIAGDKSINLSAEDAINNPNLMYAHIVNDLLSDPENFEGLDADQISGLIAKNVPDIEYVESIALAEHYLNNLKQQGLITLNKGEVTKIADIDAIRTKHYRALNQVVTHPGRYEGLSITGFKDQLESDLINTRQLSVLEANERNAKGQRPVDVIYQKLKEANIVRAEKSRIKKIAEVSETPHYQKTVRASIDHSHSPSGESFHSAAVGARSNANMLALEEHSNKVAKPSNCATACKFPTPDR